MKPVIAFAPAYCDLTFLQPFIFTRKVQDFRVGALTIREKWEQLLELSSVDLKDDRLSEFFPSVSLEAIANGVVKYIIAANLLPCKELVEQIKMLRPGQSVIAEDNKMLAGCIMQSADLESLRPIASLEPSDFKLLETVTQINLFNKEALLYDYEVLKQNCVLQPVDPSNRLIAPENIFIEKGAVVRHAILNAEEGPIFIAKNAQVMEGVCLRGPIYIGAHAVVKMGAAIYGATTIGPGCVIGGEVKNTVFFANSNKGHDGYIGDSVIGEWCNFGAGTSSSNMKNNIGNVDYQLPDAIIVTGQKKGGVLMGDFSRTAINTSINTGTWVGVSAHVFGNGLTPKIIPNFSWGFESGSGGLPRRYREEGVLKHEECVYKLDKALKDADAWMRLKGGVLSDAQKNILTELYNKR
ncbi:putative sugar nucleotidyl transferase [Niabella yanshanensis]|uniref:Sugar nucleotidyl transferase n=1 Tax=Niabella yanshanensis TaxID=577386 RepID=A0ABZ0W3Y3_9BACT|nr:putative sugar nucleotidyl transferase [Niabella yanshanensis]WQD37988.1 putative sugar nucleotidyl transferase [Niabella yanshanensis]